MLLPWVLPDTPHQNEIYDTRQSPQLLVVNRMVDAVQSGDELPLDPCLARRQLRAASPTPLELLNEYLPRRRARRTT